MSSASSDPIDQAFPDSSAPPPFTGGDPIDHAFADTSTPVSKPEDKSAKIFEQMNSGIIPKKYQPQGLADAGADKLAESGHPIFATALHTLPTAISLALPFLAKAPAGPLTTEDIVNNSLANRSQGAAAAAPDLNKISPELKQAISLASQKTGGAVNPDALTAHLEAEQHGVQLMKGQALRDPDQFTAEQNSTHPAIVARLNAQNGQMVDAIDNIRREASPTTVGNDAIENGQIAVDSLKAYDEPVKAAVSAKYQAVEDANGGKLPFDGKTFVQTADDALSKSDNDVFLPPSIRTIMDRVRDGGDFTMNKYNTLSTQLASASRAATDGNTRAAIAMVRDALESTPVTGASADVKALMNDARASAKARFDALDADPAYQAAVNDVSNGVRRGEPSPLADRFLDKFAVGSTAPKANVDLMMSKLDPDARGAVASHTLNAIRKGAVSANGNVLPNGYNAAMQKFGPKLDSLIQPETQDSLESLGRTITRAKVEPAGGKVNYSRSGVVMRDALQGAAEGFANAKTGGLYGLAKQMIPKGNALAKEALAPGAGLDELKSQ